MTLSKPDVRGFAARMGTRSGLGGGGFLELPLPVDLGPIRFALESGFMMVGRGFKAAATDFFAPQMQLPVGMRVWIAILEGWEIGAGAGVHLNYPLASMRDAAGNPYTYSARDLNRLDPGIYSAVGLTTRIGASYGFLFETRYGMSLLNVYSGSADAAWRWHDFQLILGLRLEFGSSAETEIR